MKILINILLMLAFIGLKGQVIVDENFDSSNAGWTEQSSNSASYWEWGTPARTQINDDNGGGGNAWVTGLSGTFTVDEFAEVYLVSETYDLSGITSGLVSLAINYDLGSFNTGFETINDGIILQYSTDGMNWDQLGSSSSGSNWYGQGEFFEAWMGNSGGWITATHDLPAEVLGELTVSFRLSFLSGSTSGAYSNEGFAIDDFQIVTGNVGTDMLTISIPEQLFSASIDNVSKMITLFVPEGTDVTNLAPVFTLSDGAGSDITSGTSQDFTSPVTYTITAEVSSFIETWTVQVVTPSPTISLLPKSGVAGTEVSIYGKGFSSTVEDNSVSFGSISATVTSASANKLVATVPSGASLGINEISVSSNGLNYFTEPNFTVVESGSAEDFIDYKLDNFDLGISSSVSLEVADFDDDTDLDFVYDDGATLNIATLQNGGIVNTVSVASGRSVTSTTLILETSDVNKDGYPDIIAGGSRLGWFKNNGDGSWSDENIIAASANSESLLVFDVDGDFDEDIMIFDGSNMTTYKNSGSESFGLFGSLSTNNLGVPVDWDEDGDIDIISTGTDMMSGQESVMLLSNDGAGNFISSSLASTNLSGLNSVQVGDLNIDGDIDFIYTTLSDFSGDDAIGYILNNGDGTFATETAINSSTGEGKSTKKLKLGDLNGDGFLDIARTTDDGFGTKSFVIYVSSSALAYSANQLDGSIDGLDIELVDINNDGDLDILQESSQSGGYFPLYVQGSTNLNITNFSFAEQTGVATINSTSFNINIEVSSSADLTSLVPTIEVGSDAVYVSPVSGSANDFTNSATYTLSTVDLSSSTTQDWIINVSQEPEVPMSLGVTAEQNSSEVSWNQASAAVGYELELSEGDNDFSVLVDGFNPLVINTGTTISTTLSNLTEGTNYYLRMRSINSNGTYSGYSDTLNILTKPFDPVLMDVATSSIGQDTISLTWSNVDGVIDNYTIEVSASATFASLLTGYAADTASTNFIIGKSGNTASLTENTEYWIRILANNASGASNYSNEISVLTKPATPVVNEVDNSLIDQTQATLSWNSVFASGGSYSIEVSSTDFAVASTLLNGYPLTVSGTSTVIGSDVNTDALQPATNYWVRIRSSNASGESTNSNVVSFLTKPADPVLMDVTQANVGQNIIDLSWDAISGADSYTIEVSTSETFASLLSGYPANAASAQFIIGSDGGTNSLATNTMYWVRIAANNASGASGYSNNISVLTLPETPVVNAIENANVNQTEATVAWNSVFTSGGSYNVEVSSSDFATGGTLLTGYPVTVNTTSTVVGTDPNTASLQSATNYWVRVRSSNASGESTNSNALSFLTIPSTPVAAAPTNVARESFTANWNEVNGADGYLLEVLANDETTVVFTDNTTATSSEVTGLTPGNTYKYSVQSFNSTGFSPQSNPLVEITTAEANVAPTGLSLDAESISENQPIETVIGNFSTSDFNSADTHTYSFITGTGDDDNTSFIIDGNQLLANEEFNLELKETYRIRVQTEDQDGASFSKSFDITILNVNEAPTDIVLVLDNATGYDPIGTLVAEIEAIDEDNGHTENMTFELIRGGDSFSINNETQTRTLDTKVFFTNEVDSIIPITIRAMDPNGATFDEDFDITINAFVDREAPKFVENVTNPKKFIVEGADYDSLALKAIVTDFRIKEVKLFIRFLQEAEPLSRVIPMRLIDGQEYYIDSVGVGDLGIAGIEYYFEATDEEGNLQIWSNGSDFSPSTMVLELPQSGENAPKVESVAKFGRTVDSYQIISIPFIFDNDNQSEVRSLFQEYNGGDPDQRTWRIIRFDPELGENGQLVDMEFSDNIQAGAGYFFIAQEEKQITINNAKINTQDPFPLELKQGWNLIGNPYNLDLDFDAVIANNGATDIVRQLRVLDTENPETWPMSSVLRSLEGGFVFATQDITINISYTDAFLSFGGRIVDQGVAQAEWFLPITLEQNGDFRKGGIGMDRSASASFDRYDEPVLPKWLEFLEISFNHDGEEFEKYNRDIIPVTDTKIWNFEVNSSKEGTSTLKWDISDFSMSNLKLLDVDRGIIIDMREHSSYSFNLSGKASFQLLASTDQGAQFDFEKVRIFDAYPNPFTKSFKIPVILPSSLKDGKVNVSLLDLSGRVIWSEEKKSTNAGLNEFVVERPEGLKAGVYLYRIEISDESSNSVYSKRIIVK